MDCLKKECLKKAIRCLTFLFGSIRLAKNAQHVFICEPWAQMSQNGCPNKVEQDAAFFPFGPNIFQRMPITIAMKIFVPRRIGHAKISLPKKSTRMPYFSRLVPTCFSQLSIKILFAIHGPRWAKIGLAKK